MTTIRHVRHTVRPLIERRGDLFSVVLIKPARHILRGVNLERRRDPNLLGPTLSRFSFQLRSSPTPVGAVVFIKQFILNLRSSGWDIAISETIAHLLDMIEDTLPELHAIETFEDYFAFISKLPNPRGFGDPSSIHAMKGEFAETLKILNRDKSLSDEMNGLRPRFYTVFG